MSLWKKTKLAGLLMFMLFIFAGCTLDNGELEFQDSEIIYVLSRAELQDQYQAFILDNLSVRR